MTFEAAGLPFVMAVREARYVGGVRVEWFGFLSARPTWCRRA